MVTWVQTEHLAGIAAKTKEQIESRRPLLKPASFPAEFRKEVKFNVFAAQICLIKLSCCEFKAGQYFWGLRPPEQP